MNESNPSIGMKIVFQRAIGILLFLAIKRETETSGDKGYIITIFFPSFYGGN